MTYKQRGAVSIFIVVFTALLVTVVTASFIQLMLRGQQQAVNSDLSQSAYDSALAGVEDAKRALVKLKNCELTNPGGCIALRNALESDDCEMLEAAGISNFQPNGSNSEVQVGDASLNQGYTCVTVNLDTLSVRDNLPRSGADVIELDSGGQEFDTVVLSWYNQEDLDTAGGAPIDLPSSLDLPEQANWDPQRPPLMRAQLIQFLNDGPNSLVLSDFDGANARTRFLMPSLDLGGSGGATSFAADTRTSAGTNSPIFASCYDTTPDYEGYFCRATISLPDPVGGNAANRADREAYLQVSPYYVGTHYMVQLRNGNTPITFRGVQPIVDSTGRASDLFRRISARVSVTDGGTPIVFPNTALSVDSNVCKNFFITDDPTQYSSECEAE